MKTQNLAVMFTDIQGFTAKTSRQTREENALMLRRHDALLVPVVRAFGGRRVKSIGDAFLVAFASATNSILCGMAIQDRLWDYNRRVPEEDRIEVRVAVSLGEVRVVRSVGSTDVFGEPVNVAARVEGEARVGEVWFTEAVYLAMNKAEVSVEEIGYRELKGIPEKVRLYRVAQGRHALAVTSPLDAAATPMPQPPYGNVGLSTVKSLPPPDPAELSRGEPARPDLKAIASRIGRLRSALPSRAYNALAVGLVVAVVAAVAIGWMNSRTERLIERGRFEEAWAAVEALAERKGQEDPEVLYLWARLLHERSRRGEGGSMREALELYSRALAAGSSGARAQLAQLTEAKDCPTRRLAARALGESRSREALAPLRRLAEKEPEESSDPVRAFKRFFGGDVHCGAGDLARDAIRQIEAASSTPG